jgi:hypothetical protein
LTLVALGAPLVALFKSKFTYLFFNVQIEIVLVDPFQLPFVEYPSAHLQSALPGSLFFGTTLLPNP